MKKVEVATPGHPKVCNECQDLDRDYRRPGNHVCVKAGYTVLKLSYRPDWCPYAPLDKPSEPVDLLKSDPAVSKHQEQPPTSAKAILEARKAKKSSPPPPIETQSTKKAAPKKKAGPK